MNDAQALQRAQKSRLSMAAVLFGGAEIIIYKHGSFVRFLGGENC